jgi:excisionase family DNA binding protein
MDEGETGMTTTDQGDLLTTSDVAKMLYLHINTVRRWSDQGILKPYRIGPRGDRRFLRQDVIHFLTTQRYGE